MLINITTKLLIVFIAGVLIGAIIATAGFLIFAKSCKSHSDRFAPPSFNQAESSEMPGNNQFRQMPGKDNQSGKQNQPPQKPDSNSQEDLPQVPDFNNQESSN